MALKTNRTPLHETDETAWLEKTADLLRQGRFKAVDAHALAQYLVDVAISDRRRVEGHLVTLLIHMLKWAHQPEKRSRSWEDTIAREQHELQGLFQSKTLRNHAKAVREQVYARAVKRAAIQTGLDKRVFPMDCPYTLESLLEDV